MAIAKTILFCFLLFTFVFFYKTAISAEPEVLHAVIDTNFISLKKNPLANPLKGLLAQVGELNVDGLIQYTLLLQPEDGMPESGWPVIIFNHGFHSEPHKNGRRTIDGVSDRPGDYYRQIPQRFARKGFLVIAPDYRGHNDSSGAEYTLQESSPNWYARDVLGIIDKLQSTGSANMDHLFMLGHSMGAEVTLLAAAALGDKLKGVSIWSAYVPKVTNSSVQQPKLKASSQLDHLYGPINIHHSKNDLTTAFKGSVMIANRLDQLGKTGKLYSYLSANHLFTDENLELAITRDTALFRHIMLSQERPLD